MTDFCHTCGCRVDALNFGEFQDEFEYIPQRKRSKRYQVTICRTCVEDAEDQLEAWLDSPEAEAEAAFNRMALEEEQKRRVRK